MRLELVQGDIAMETSDAIVNAANTSLLGGGSVDGAIHRAGQAGDPRGVPGARRVRDRRREGDRRRQAQFVLHAVGPVWSGEGEPELLDSCYRRSLELVRLVCFSPESRDAFAAARAEVGIG